MNPIGIIYNNNITSSFDEVINALLKSEVSLVNRGDSIYVFCENGSKSVLIITQQQEFARLFWLMMVLHIKELLKKQIKENVQYV